MAGQKPKMKKGATQLKNIVTEAFGDSGCPGLAQAASRNTLPGEAFEEEARGTAASTPIQVNARATAREAHSLLNSLRERAQVRMEAEALSAARTDAQLR